MRRPIHVGSFAILMLGCIALMPSIAHAADYYVAPGGDDANPGTLDQPWRHIAYSTCGGSYLCPIATSNPNKLKAGDTLYLRAGTYVENRIGFTNSGTSANPIVVRAYPGESPVVDGGFTAVSNGTEIVPVFDIGAIAGQGSHYITLDGLRITRGSRANVRIAENTASSNIVIKNCEIDDIKTYDNSAGVYVDSEYSKVLIANNRIHDFEGEARGANGVLLFTGANDVVVASNEVFNLTNGVFYKHGVNDSLAIPIIRNNVIRDISYSGIMLATDNTLVENNVIYNAGYAAIRVYNESSGCDRVGGFRTTIRHNTVASGAAGITLFGPTACLDRGARHTIVKDNLVFGFADAEKRGLSVWMWQGADESNTTFDHNLVYAAAFSEPVRVLNTNYSAIAAPLAGAGNLQQTPVFVNAASGDYTLAATSPGKNAASDGEDMGARVCAVGPKPTCAGPGDTLAPAAPSNLTVQ